MNKEMTKKELFFASATVISIFCLGQIPGSIDAALSKISEYFHLDSATGLYVTTVASITSVLFGIVVGIIAGRKITFKKLIYLAAALEIVTAIAPFFTDSFPVILVLRALFGVGFGAMQSLENIVATLTIPEDRRASVLGLGNFFGFGINCLLQFVGGLLADIRWNYVFLNHILLLIPFVVLLICCPDIQPAQESAAEASAEETKSARRFSSNTVLMWIMMLVVGILIAPLLIGCSFLSERIDPSATVAGIVAVCFSVGCMVGGLLFSKLFRKLQKKSLPFFLLLMAVGSLGCALTRNIVVLCVLIFVAGIGFSTGLACSMMVVGLSCSPAQITLASSVLMALYNLGMFLSSPFESLVGRITGDALYWPLYIGTAVFLAFALLFLLRSPIPSLPEGER